MRNLLVSLLLSLFVVSAWGEEADSTSPPREVGPGDMIGPGNVPFSAFETDGQHGLSKDLPSWAQSTTRISRLSACGS